MYVPRRRAVRVARVVVEADVLDGGGVAVGDGAGAVREEVVEPAGPARMRFSGRGWMGEEAVREKERERERERE